MTIADWTIAAAVFLTYIVMLPAKLDPSFDNRDPRACHAAQKGLRRRAYSAHLNGFEALVFFIPAVLLAEFRGAPQGFVDAAALVFVVARAAYGACYLANLGALRSVAWAVGFLSACAIFVSPLWS